MKVVCNTTPIISLASVGQLALLADLFGRVHIPQAVYDEVKYKQSFGYQEIDKPCFEVANIQGNDYTSRGHGCGIYSTLFFVKSKALK